VAGTLDYGLHYERAPNTARFIGYYNSDLAGNLDTSKSTTRTMSFLNDCLVSWQSLKQKVVALSSCEVKYIATTNTITQALWLSRMLAELLRRKVDVVELKGGQQVYSSSGQESRLPQKKQAYMNQVSLHQGLLGGWEHQGQPHCH
jgi:hypothetical protein